MDPLVLDGTVLQVNLQTRQLSLFLDFFGGIFNCESESGLIFLNQLLKCVAARISNLT